jgi:hypothetical protein
MSHGKANESSMSPTTAKAMRVKERPVLLRRTAARMSSIDVLGEHTPHSAM